MQNALLRAAREAEPEETHTIFAMGTHDGSDLEHTVNASWYDATRTKIHGFEIGEVALAEARSKFKCVSLTVRVRLGRALGTVKGCP